jgi:hypothetical protein
MACAINRSISFNQVDIRKNLKKIKKSVDIVKVGWYYVLAA